MRKIPFDETPIIRPEVSQEIRSEKSSLSSFAKTIICLLLISNIILGCLIINVYTKGGITQEVSSPTINNTNQGSSISYATSKAVLSTVCVSAGTYVDKNGTTHTASELEYFYNVSSRGSGVIFKDNKSAGQAYIVSNYHVVSPDEKNIYVLLYGSQVPVKAELVGYSSTYDISVLKIECPEYSQSGAIACTIANSADISIGDICVAIGNPIAMGISSSIGNVSVPYEFVGVEGGGTARVIRTDAAINSGNSGGGLFNENGDLIGVVNAKINSTAVENIAFAIPSNLAISIANNIIRNNGTLKKLVIGMTIQIKSSKSVYDTKTNKTKIEYNIKVTEVTAGSRASACGIAENDEFISFSYDGKTIKFDYMFAIEDNVFNMDTGTTLSFKVRRMFNGEMIEEDVEFVARASDFATVA